MSQGDPKQKFVIQDMHLKRCRSLRLPRIEYETVHAKEILPLLTCLVQVGDPSIDYILCQAIVGWKGRGRGTMSGAAPVPARYTMETAT